MAIWGVGFVFPWQHVGVIWGFHGWSDARESALMRCHECPHGCVCMGACLVDVGSMIRRAFVCSWGGSWVPTVAHGDRACCSKSPVSCVTRKAEVRGRVHRDRGDARNLPLNKQPKQNAKKAQISALRPRPCQAKTQKVLFWHHFLTIFTFFFCESHLFRHSNSKMAFKMESGEGHFGVMGAEQRFWGIPPNN